MLPTYNCLPHQLSFDLKDFILSYLRDDLGSVMKKSIQQYVVEGAWCRERRLLDVRSRGKKSHMLSLRRSAKDCASAFIVASGKSQNYELCMTDQDEMDHCIVPSKIPVYYRRELSKKKNVRKIRKNRK